MVPVLLGLVVILLAAKIGGEVFERLGQPAVLGELLTGILLGNLALAASAASSSCRARRGSRSSPSSG